MLLGHRTCVCFYDYFGELVKDDEVGGACDTNAGEEKCE